MQNSLDESWLRASLDRVVFKCFHPSEPTASETSTAARNFLSSDTPHCLNNKNNKNNPDPPKPPPP